MNRDTAVLDISQMGEVDRLSIIAGTSGIDLMERAGQAVAYEIQRRWPVRPTLVLCGPGKNGGDGLVVARLLVDAGWPVRVALLGQRHQFTGDALYHAGLWTRTTEELTPAALDGAELIVDALFGSGLSHPLAGPARDTLTYAASQGLPIIAIDVPSGLMGDSGEALGAVASVLTVTFVRKKPAHLLLPGRTLCGEVMVADIGIPPSIIDQVHPTTFENGPSVWLSGLPRPHEISNKYSRGHAIIFGGYPVTGAARMAAHATSRAGAGLTTVAVPAIAFPIYAMALTSIMVRQISEPPDFDNMLADKRITAMLIGPGAEPDEKTRNRVKSMLNTRRPTLIDAGAITAFENDAITLMQAIAGPCILSPHEAEFSRLFDLKGDKLTRAREAAHRSGAILILKGSDTIIAAPDGRAIINANAPPTLATAGSGDVLSGIVLGLLAQGMDPFLAAAAGVWLHGAAATAFGPGLMAEDLPDLLPGVLRRLFAWDTPSGGQPSHVDTTA